MESVTIAESGGKKDLELIAAECLDLMDIAGELRKGRLTQFAQRIERKVRIIAGAAERTITLDQAKGG